MTELGAPRRGVFARRSFARVERKLATVLGPDERLESAFYAHRYIPGGQLLLFFGALGDIVYLVVARPYYVALTSSRLFVLKAGRGFRQRVGEPELTAERASVRIGDPKTFLVRKVTTVTVAGGQSVRLAVHRSFWRELAYMRALLDGRDAG